MLDLEPAKKRKKDNNEEPTVTELWKIIEHKDHVIKQKEYALDESRTEISET